MLQKGDYMAVYTRTGDKGSTKLVGGEKVRKCHPRVESYGTTDELCSIIGFSLSLLDDQTKELREDLLVIQQLVFDCSSDLAVPRKGMRPFKVSQDRFKWLEANIDYYWKQCPTIDKFILPGGTQLASSLHIARTVTRRAERHVVCLMDSGEDINEDVLIFLNRLSDYFFVMARFVNIKTNEAEIDYENSPQVFSRGGKSVSNNNQSKE